LRQKADEIALQLNTEFTLSNGWFDQVRKYAGLSYRTTSRESGSVTEKQVDAWKTGILPSLLSEYRSMDIFNADECVLFFNLFPGKTYAFIGESCQ
jgi:hypothetical protein